MNIEQLQGFFFWCMIINSGIYAITAIAVLVMRDVLNTIHGRMFGMDEEAVGKALQSYMGRYKLFITVFNFTPWIALLIIG